MAFWSQPDPASESAEHPPVTDEAAALCQHKIGLKLPPALIALLKTKNGGHLENFDFRIGSIDYQVGSILGIGIDDSFYDFQPVSSFLNPSDPFEAEFCNKFAERAGDLSKLLRFALDIDGLCYYALDYNHLNSQGEPKVVVVVTTGEEPCARPLADSIEQFLNSQYVGDPDPIVRLEEASRLELIAEGGYLGTSEVSGKAVNISWKLLTRGSKLIALSSEEWGLGQGVELIRAELDMSDLCFGGELPENFESELAELGPEVLGGIRSQVMAPPIEFYDVSVRPRCYVLRLSVQLGEAWVKCQSSKTYKGRWKNRLYGVVYGSLYSSDKHLLERTLMTLTRICSI